MRIISINVNGIRNAAALGLFDWLNEQAADVICLQDTRASNDEVENLALQLNDYFCFAEASSDPEHGGVAIISRVAPRAIITTLGSLISDHRGQFIQADFDKISIASLLFPMGRQNHEALAKKARFMSELLPFLDKHRRKRRDYIFSTSAYIAHQKNDVKYWREAQAQPGFLPEERAWMDEIIHGLGYIDAFREANKDNDQFSWWPDSEQAHMLNLGLRIDYQFLTPGLKRTVKNARIVRNARFSAHAPVQIDYQWSLEP